VENNNLSGCIPQNLASYGSSGGCPDIGLGNNKFAGLIPITSFRAERGELSGGDEGFVFEFEVSDNNNSG
jgi:hypothetical protein